MKKAKCYNCREISHIAKTCKKPKKKHKTDKKTDKRANKNNNKKFREKKFNDQMKKKKIRQQQARTALKDLDSYDDSNSSENLKTAHLVNEIDKYDDDLSKIACYAAENENKITYQIKTDLQ